MKKLILSAVMLGTSHGYAQTTNLTFQWHGQTMGLDFEATNLTKSVKIAIRNDIAYSMSLIPTNNVTFDVLAPGHPDFGSYTGFVDFLDVRINYCSGVLCGYKTDVGNVRWQIGEETSSKYLAAIAVTNQHALAIAAFTNYFNQFTGGQIDNSSMTLAEKKALLWNPPFLQQVKKAYGDTDKYEELIGGMIPRVPAPPGACPFPSILAFTIETDLPDEWNPTLLCCEVRYWAEGIYGGPRKFLFCYVEGTWRFSPGP